MTSPQGTTGLASTQTGHEDLRQVWLGEPDGQAGKVVFTLKMDNLSPQPIPGHRWYIYFKVPGDTDEHWVAMDTLQGNPKFTYGIRETFDPAGQLPVGVYTEAGTIDAQSSYDPDGTITLVMDRSLFGLQDGDELSGLAASIRETSNPVNGAGLTVDSAAGGSYTLVGSTVCARPDGTVDGGNDAPTAELEVPNTASVGENLSFVVTVNDDDGDPLSYELDFGDGSTPATGTSSGTVTHSYSAADTYNALLTVTDPSSASGTATAEIVVSASQTGGQKTIVAKLTADPVSGNAPIDVHFDATSSAYSDREEVEADGFMYTFVFGDEAQAEDFADPQGSPTATHRYEAAGTFSAYVIVTDKDNNFDDSSRVTIQPTVTVTVTAGNGTVAQLTVDKTAGAAPLRVSFDGSRSFPADGATITSYSFDFGDGTVVTGAEQTATHVYTVPGNYDPSLTVTDSEGDQAVAKVTMKVQSAPDTSTPPVTPSGASGASGGMPLLVLLALTGMAWVRRIRRSSAS